jgi:hypothetical protein
VLVRNLPAQRPNLGARWSKSRDERFKSQVKTGAPSTTEGMRHPREFQACFRQNPVPRGSLSTRPEGKFVRGVLLCRGYPSRAQGKKPRPTKLRAAGRTEGLGARSFKPAPFAEKKNAKDAAPAKSNRGAIEVRCQAEGCATRRASGKIRCRAEACPPARKAAPPAIQNCPGDGGTAVNTP